MVLSCCSWLEHPPVTWEEWMTLQTASYGHSWKNGTSESNVSLWKFIILGKWRAKGRPAKWTQQQKEYHRIPWGQALMACNWRSWAHSLFSFLFRYPLCQNWGRFHSCIIGLWVDTLLLNLWPCVKLQSFVTSQQTFSLSSSSSKDGTCSWELKYAECV